MHRSISFSHYGVQDLSAMLALHANNINENRGSEREPTCGGMVRRLVVSPAHQNSNPRFYTDVSYLGGILLVGGDVPVELRRVYVCTVFRKKRKNRGSGMASRPGVILGGERTPVLRLISCINVFLDLLH